MKCFNCSQLAHPLGSSIDHKTEWATYLGQFTPQGGALTMAEAKYLSNDQYNLAVVHSKCNSQQSNEMQGITRGGAQDAANQMSPLKN